MADYIYHAGLTFQTGTNGQRMATNAKYLQRVPKKGGGWRYIYNKSTSQARGNSASRSATIRGRQNSSYAQLSSNGKITGVARSASVADRNMRNGTRVASQRDKAERAAYPLETTVKDAALHAKVTINKGIQAAGDFFSNLGNTVMSALDTASKAVGNAINSAVEWVKNTINPARPGSNAALSSFTNSSGKSSGTITPKEQMRVNYQANKALGSGTNRSNNRSAYSSVSRSLNSANPINTYNSAVSSYERNSNRNSMYGTNSTMKGIQGIKKWGRNN